MTATGVGDADDVVGNLEAFAEQSIKKRPLRHVLEVTGQALVDAAKFVSKSAAPVAEAVTAVMKAAGAV